MNCKQIEELLPLYAGRDLDEERFELVTAHLQACDDCARAAHSYREAVELTQQFAPPVFSDHVYTSVRRQVMQQIEDEPSASLLPQLFDTWFRPRMAWAAASALIIAFGFFALYLVVNRKADVQPVANIQPALNGTEQTPESTPSRTTVSAGPEKRKPAEHTRKHLVNRRPLMAVKAVDSSLRAASISPKPRDPQAVNGWPVVDATPGKTPLRVEMQTKDPNIRIIWFSQSNSKPTLPNSKGI
jgi:hypothetical protein